jgi:hypothetical protein
MFLLLGISSNTYGSKNKPLQSWWKAKTISRQQQLNQVQMIARNTLEAGAKVGRPNLAAA